MQLMRNLGALVVLASVVGCGDHYEGGGRREEVPTDTTSTSGGPNIGLGGGTSTSGGTATGGTDTSGTDTGGSSGAGGVLFAAGTGGSL